MDTPQHAVSAEQPAALPHLTRDHMCLLASQVYTRDADALYYGDGRRLPSAADRAESERLYQLAQEVASEVTGDPEHISTLWTEASAWLRGAL